MMTPEEREQFIELMDDTWGYYAELCRIYEITLNADDRCRLLQVRTSCLETLSWLERRLMHDAADGIGRVGSLTAQQKQYRTGKDDAEADHRDNK